MLRRVLAFWLACVLVVAVVSAWDTWISGNIEPDFGDAFGNFGTFVLILAVLAIPAAVFHAIAVFLLRRTASRASQTYALISSALSGALFVVLLLTWSLPLDVPVKPLLLPSSLGFLASVVVLFVAGLIQSKQSIRAA